MKYQDGNLVDLSTIVDDVLKVIFEENKDDSEEAKVKDAKTKME